MYGWIKNEKKSILQSHPFRLLSGLDQLALQYYLSSLKECRVFDKNRKLPFKIDTLIRCPFLSFFVKFSLWLIRFMQLKSFQISGLKCIATSILPRAKFCILFEIFSELKLRMRSLE